MMRKNFWERKKVGRKPKISPSDTSSCQCYLSYRDFSFHFSLFNCVYAYMFCVRLYTDECDWPQTLEEVLRCPEAGVTVGNELTNMSAGNLPQVLCKKTTCS